MQSIINQPKPHFYEYMQIQLLQSYIQRGIGYFITSISNSSNSLVWLRYYGDQIGFVIDLLKDVVCLFKYNATYAEQFYSLQRKSLVQISDNSKRYIKILSHALISTFIPYVLNKIQKRYNNLVQQQQNQGRILNVFQKIFTKIYPYLHLIISAIQTLMKFKYLLLKQERVFDLYYKFAGTSLMYKQSKFAQGQQGKTTYPWMDLIKTPGLLTMMLGHKVLTWYFTQKNQRNLSADNNNGNSNKMSLAEKYLSPLSALQKKDFIKKQSANSKATVPKRKQFTKGLCLVCSKSITNPTVVKQNGHVFCYACITEYVRENGHCPITNIKLSQQNLQLVYSEK